MKKQEKDYTNIKIVSLLILVCALLLFCIVYIGHETSVRNEERDQPLAKQNIKGMIMLGLIQPEYLGEATRNDKPIYEATPQRVPNGDVYALFQDNFGRYFWSRIQ